MSEYRTINLTRGQVAIIDEEDFQRISQEHWCAIKIKGRYYAIQGKRTNLYMHRIIMGATDDEQIDHVNNNGLDNRKRNLRRCTNAQNNWNKGKHRDNTSGFKGVSYDPDRGKWRARLMVNGKFVWLGRHHTAQAAYMAYTTKAKEVFGEFFHP